ncbi:hypothetical protein HDV02_003057 [Globomyces sp. JEL0801]|nr:hypothetical protein HDV02_003057 [Globomyces sp. JEL0801]
MLRLLNQRELTPTKPNGNIIQTLCKQSKGTFNAKVLKQHEGCVNAISISKNGQLLATGGDDLDILVRLSLLLILMCLVMEYVWRFECLMEPFKEIQRCGNDGLLLRFDLQTENTSIISEPNYSNRILAHHDACLRVSVDPKNDNIVLTAGQDWSIKLWDIRCKTAQGTMFVPGRGQNHAQFNPVIPNLFVTADDKGGIFLFDIRTAFSKSSDKEPIIQYTTRLVKQNKISKPSDITSATWSADGKMLGANIQRWYPTIYHLNDPDPICLLKTNAIKNQHFKSLATIKTASFCESLGSRYFFAGSDDYCAYGWKIPSLTELISERQISSEEETWERRLWGSDVFPNPQTAAMNGSTDEMVEESDSSSENYAWMDDSDLE